MRAVLNKRVNRLEAKMHLKPTIWVWFIKFNMKRIRAPLCTQNSKPDQETCRRFGRWNIEAVKAIRFAKADGRDILKTVDRSGKFPDFENCYCECDPTMTHDDWVLHFEEIDKRGETVPIKANQKNHRKKL